jgi:hypothetical protein
MEFTDIPISYNLSVVGCVCAVVVDVVVVVVVVVVDIWFKCVVGLSPPLCPLSRLPVLCHPVISYRFCCPDNLSWRTCFNVPSVNDLLGQGVHFQCMLAALGIEPPELIMLMVFSLTILMNSLLSHLIRIKLQRLLLLLVVLTSQESNTNNNNNFLKVTK